MMLKEREFCVCDGPSERYFWTDFAQVIGTTNHYQQFTVPANWEDEDKEYFDIDPVIEVAAKYFNVPEDDIELCSFDPDHFPENFFEYTGAICADCGGWV